MRLQKRHQHGALLYVPPREAAKGDARKADGMADSAKESKDNKRKRGAAAKKEKDREKDRPPPAPPFQDIKLPEKYRLLPVPKADAANAQSDDVVQLSRTAKAPQITLQDDMLTAIGCKGYRMVRATHGVGSGSWYFEVRVNTPLNGEDGHTRLGWCTDMGELQAPVGYDHNSYAYRDRVAHAAIDSPGSTFHKSNGAEYGGTLTLTLTLTLALALALALTPTLTQPLP